MRFPPLRLPYVECVRRLATAFKHADIWFGDTFYWRRLPSGQFDIARITRHSSPTSPDMSSAQDYDGVSFHVWIGEWEVSVGIVRAKRKSRLMAGADSLCMTTEDDARRIGAMVVAILAAFSLNGAILDLHDQPIEEPCVTHPEILDLLESPAYAACHRPLVCFLRTDLLPDQLLASTIGEGARFMPLEQAYAMLYWPSVEN